MKFLLKWSITYICILTFQLQISAKTISMITLEDVVSGKFAEKGIGNVKFLPNGDYYTIQSKRKLILHSSANPESQKVLLDLDEAIGEKPDAIVDCVITPNMKYVLVEADRRPIYRHSAVSNYYLYNIRSKKMRLLSSKGNIESLKLSPDGSMVGFVRDNDLYVVTLKDRKEKRITNDGRFNHVINGKPDWVNEEEFSYKCAFDFSSDGRFIAWIRFDETDVPTFSFPISKHVDGSDSVEMYEYKYPKAGETNSKVSVFAYDIYNKECCRIKVPVDADGYIPRIQFTCEANKLAVVTLNRAQNVCSIYKANPSNGDCELLVSESNSTYVDESFYQNLDFSHERFVLLSERDGFRHLYLYDMKGTMIKQLSRGDFEVIDYYGQDDKGRFYYSSNEGSPLEQYVYSVDEKGEKLLLTKDKGVNIAVFDDKCNYFIKKWSSLKSPSKYALCDNKGNELYTMEDNNALIDALNELESSSVDFFQFAINENVLLNGWMVKPDDFDANKKYPVLMFQYSGPGNQKVKNQWANGLYSGLLWEKRLAQKGYIVVCVDGRGTGGRGEEWRKTTYKHLGYIEANDQVETALYLSTLPYVDSDRIAIWGWSYGGWNTLMAMSEGRPVFNCGIAVAPVTSFRFYDTIYTERYMGLPSENSDAYDDNPMTRADKLHGDVLLVHGYADDNVHFENMEELTKVYEQHGIQFEKEFYANRNHHLNVGNTRLHLLTRMENFLDRHMEKKNDNEKERK